MKYLKGLLLTINVILILVTLAAYLAPYIPPKTNGLIASMGLVYPILILGHLLYILIWIILKPPLAINSILVVLLGFFFAKNTLGYSTTKTTTSQQKTIKVGTYNMQFSKPIRYSPRKQKEKIKASFNRFLNQINDIDILGVQECGWRSQSHIQQTINYPYQYFMDTIYMGIYSKYPIIHKGYIDFGQKINRCLWADIVIRQDTIRFYTAHLEPNRHDGKIPIALNLDQDPVPTNLDHIIAEADQKNITTELDRDKVTELVQDKVTKRAIREKITPSINQNKVAIGIDLKKQEKINSTHLLGIFKHYQIFAQKRAEQAAIIHAHQSKSPYPVIITGDFNDPPQSYTYSIINKGLKDSFIESDYGFGVTRAITLIGGVRIDYILANPIFNFTKHKIHRVNFSDHYFVESELQY